MTSPNQGGVKTTQRTYSDTDGTEHRVVFREIDQGQCVNIYDVELDGVLIPRLDQVLYASLLNMTDEQLAHYFSTDR